MKITNHKQKGFSIFIAVIVMGVLMVIAFSIAYISNKEAKFATTNRDSQYALFAADAGVECALYWDSKFSVSKFDPSVSGSPISCNGQSLSTGSAISGTTTTTLIGGGGGTVTETVWMEDSLPAGAVPQGDSFNWVSSNPAPFSGSLANQSANSGGMHQQFFINASPTFVVGTGDTMIAYVYLDPSSPPTEIMLQWNEGNWEHRAYWGANSIGWGNDGTDSRRYMGSLPATGQWVRLQVPASQVGLENRSVNGMAFTLYDGKATWDHIGKVVVSGGSNLTSVFGFSLNSVQNPSNACAIVTVTKNAGLTQIFSRGYNNCNLSDPRRVERGIEVRY